MAADGIAQAFSDWGSAATEGSPMDYMRDAQHSDALAARNACARTLFVEGAEKITGGAWASHALAVCAGCDVQEECLAYALEGCLEGIYGPPQRGTARR